jgi:hypothetical protein
MKEKAKQFVQDNMKNFIPRRYAGGGNESAPLVGSFEQLVIDYQTDLQNKVAALAQTGKFSGEM